MDTAITMLNFLNKPKMCNVVAFNKYIIAFDSTGVTPIYTPYNITSYHPYIALHQDPFSIASLQA